jgi:putative IMPACT (imprinted ancient) family translation regulator
LAHANSPKADEILDKQFAEQISLQLKLPAEQIDALRKALTDLSSGSIELPTADQIDN